MQRSHAERFARIAAGGLLAAALPVHASGKLNIGVGTYSYHNLSMDDMIVQLNLLHVSEIEMSRGEFMLMNHPGDDLFHSARSKLDAAGIRCVSYYSATIKDDQDLENALRFAQLLGARNVTGDATGSILNRIDQRFSQAGMTFGIHNHYFKGEKFAYESPEDVLRALSGLSSHGRRHGGHGAFRILRPRYGGCRPKTWRPLEIGASQGRRSLGRRSQCAAGQRHLQDF